MHFAGCPEVLGKSVLKSVLIALIAGKALGVSASYLRSSVDGGLSAVTLAGSKLLAVVGQWKRSIVSEGGRMHGHPLQARQQS